MFEKIIKTCNEYEPCYKRSMSKEHTKDDWDFITYFNLELAKSLILDLDSNNAREVAKIILATVGENTNKPWRY